MGINTVYKISTNIKKKQYHHKIEEKKQNIMAKLRNRKRIWKKITNEIFQKKKYEKEREL